MDRHEIWFWNANAWHVFDDFGAKTFADAIPIARRLSLLFRAVEIHSTVNGELTITKV